MKYDSKKYRWKAEYGENIFFTSDHHFGHTNIIKYCNRPFESVQKMDEIMILNWNNRVGPNDTVIHVGDFALCSSEYALKVRNRLNGKIHIVWGNHDKVSRYLKWESTGDYMELKIADYPSIVIAHYAHKVWNKMHKGAWHLYGHSHGTLPDDPYSKSFDIGVDCWNFTPITISQIDEKMEMKQFKPVDHHNGDRE